MRVLLIPLLAAVVIVVAMAMLARPPADQFGTTPTTSWYR
jgi:hypothetical protein